MKSILLKNSVLILNRSWQAINVTTPTNAIAMMYTGTATGLETKGEDIVSPLRWHEWARLPYDEDYEHIHTISQKIRIPKIIILCNYNKVPILKPDFTSKNLWQRDRGICQYTGKKLTPKTGNIDHVIPKSRGGKSTWTNCVLCHKDVNSIKGNKTPAEAGLRLIAVPREPAMLPITMYIQNPDKIKEWTQFLTC
jgi:5-methylcytosine-specific restriction endonuclease McrA